MDRSTMECGICFKALFKKPKDWEYQAVSCSHCKGIFCVSHIRSYVDGSNEAITRNSPKYCINCFYLFHNHNGDVRREPRKRITC